MIPLVSIVIPVYNAEAFIEETVQSVLKQTYTNIEVIIVNDGSTDSSLEKVQAFASDGRVTVLGQTNAGVAVARNKGLNHASGKYIAFLDSDDVWLPNFLQKRIDVLEEQHEVGMITSNMQFIDAKSSLLGVIEKGLDGKAFRRVIEFEQGYGTCPSNFLTRKSLVETVGGFNQSLSNVADKLFVLEISQLTSVMNIPEVTLYYRIHANNMHSNLSLMIADYKRYLSIISEKQLLSKAEFTKLHSRISYIFAGAYLSKRKFGFFSLSLLKSFLLSPTFVLQRIFSK